jgi:hypothetical protein
MTKAVFNKKKILFTSKFYLNLRKKIVNWRTWFMALCGDENGHFGNKTRNTLNALKSGSGEGWRISIGPIM